MVDTKIITIGKVVNDSDLAALRNSIKDCMQCGTCAATCPVANEMDYTPRQVIHLLSLGLKDKALNSTSIWTCASCTHCTAKCPRSIDITDMMYRLRSMAIRQGYRTQPGMVFTKGFLQVVKEHGRSFEPEILIRYSMVTNPFALLKQVGFALTMLSRNKISPFPDRIEGREQVRKILNQDNG